MQCRRVQVREQVRVGLADKALISPLCVGEAFEMRCGNLRRDDETGGGLQAA